MKANRSAYNIVIVNPLPEHSATIRQEIEKLKDVRVDSERYFIRGSSLEKTLKEITRLNPHMVLIDGNLQGHYKSSDLADNLEKKLPHVPTIGMRSINYPAMDRTSFDDIWEIESEELSKKIRSKMYRRLNVAVIGIGNLGIKLIDDFIGSQDVANIHAYSDTTPLDLIHQYLEGKARSSKLQIKDNLEATLKGTDLVCIATSALHGRAIPDITQREDRFDLFPYEAIKYGGLFTRIGNCSYDGLISVFANPIPLLLEQGRRLGQEGGGINADQLFSPFDPDISRCTNGLKEILKDTPWSEEKGFQVEMPRCVVGVHGKPHIIVPSHLKGKKQQISQIEKEAAKIPFDSHRAAIKLGLPLRIPIGVTNLPTINALACYSTQIPNSHVYVEIEGLSGFMALPTKVNYNRWRVMPDGEAINQLGERAVRDILKPLLRDANEEYIKLVRSLR